jgi:nucleotide-binding universal stress UspA family protein
MKKSVRKPVKKAAPRASRTRTRRKPFTIGKILVPIDFSVHARNALQYAITFAEKFRAALRLVYVVEPTIYPADLGFGQVVLPEIEDELAEKGKGELEGIIKSDIGKRCAASATVRTGKPHQEILLEAEEQNVDMIIVATRGHTGVEHMLFGSTAERIIRNARVPVLTIHPAEEK